MGAHEVSLVKVYNYEISVLMGKFTVRTVGYFRGADLATEVNILIASLKLNTDIKRSEGVRKRQGCQSKMSDDGRPIYHRRLF